MRYFVVQKLRLTLDFAERALNCCSICQGWGGLYDRSTSFFGLDAYCRQAGGVLPWLENLTPRT